MDKNTSWGNVAKWYDDVVNDPDSYQASVLLPNVKRLVSANKGDRILDIACGQGFFSHALAGDGAFVTGVDISPELISIAKKHAGHTEEFFVTPSHSLSAFRDNSFDVAICVLAMQNIERMAETMKDAQRVVRKKGKLILVINHPAFRIPGKTHWGFDEKTDTQYRRVDGYMGEVRAEIDMHPGKATKEKTYSFHHPIQVYSKNLANAGFSISRIEEWMSHKESGNGPRKAAEDRARREFPLFMCFECIKA